MNRLITLKQERAALAETAKQLVTKLETEKRTFTGEEQTKYDELFSKISEYSGSIRALEQDSQIEAMLKDKRAEVQAETGKDPEEQVTAFRSFLRAGASEMPPEQRQHLVTGNHFAMDFRANNPQAVGTPSLGGYTVPQGFYARVVEAMKFFGGMVESGAFILSTAMGNDVPVPTSDDTAQMGAIFAENQQVTTQEITFGSVTLKAYKYSSKIVLIPIELLQDSGVDIEGFTVKQLAARLARIQNYHFTNGTGTAQPRGVLADAVTGVTGPGSTAWSGGGASGATGGLDYASLVNLKYSVNRLYRVGAKWMMNDNTLAAMLQLVDDNHRPLILNYLTSLQEDEPERLLGQPIVINNDLPNLGSAGSPVVGNQAILYGQFSNYWIRRVMNMVMLRLTERYADLGQVGFLAFMRTDGRMVDAGQNPIKAFVSKTT